ncbi:MAG: alpha-glucan family phosphorylase, partial [Lentisphaeria bacterium]|nr:alpha-glucan family phosphorylase [Lentisphaeria bacterium]
NNFLKLYNVAPLIPAELRFLEELSFNMWWCYHPEAQELFERIDPALWQASEGNTRLFMSKLPQKKLEELAKDQLYIKELKNVENAFHKDVKVNNDISKCKIAYFSMEFGIHESVRIFSGGLGVLAGDHLKAASDLHLPLAGVGLLYRQGYFRQVLDSNGWQQERYPENEIHNMPITRATDLAGNEVTITIPLAERMVSAAVWILKVGNVPLILLDTEIPQNPPELRSLTWRLYGGDTRNRIQQEILLGVGGYEALTAMGITPEVCHMNEGHAAFLALARIAHLTRTFNYSPDTALEIVWRSNVFTTHTPVPAGNEVFDFNMVRPFMEVLCKAANIDVERMLKWGVPFAERNSSTQLSMTVLGMHMANFCNGVSKLHGEVARRMWQNLWPGRALDEIPIKHITNGVHPASWISNRKRTLFDHYLAGDYLQNPDYEKLRLQLDMIPDYELWAAHELCRQSLVRCTRQRLQKTLKCAVCNPEENSEILDPHILTIGFARRFATYKRGTLLLRYRDRLLRLLADKTTPVQFIFAGKAHPADDNGKRLIQELVQFARQNRVSHKLVFLEDYDIGLARKLVQGVDVWLNNP